MKKNVAFIFPAFITDFTGKELTFLEESKIDINEYLQKISFELNIRLPKFSYDSDIYRGELTSQLLAYSFGCAFSDVLKMKNIHPDFLAGYSMGIYASLYAAESITFESGAQIIHQAFNLIQELSESKVYGMGSVIGLSVEDIEKLIRSNSLDIEIININNAHSSVIAGKKNDVVKLLEHAKEEGALSVAELTVNTPYHSKFLKDYGDQFKTYLDQKEFNDPNLQIVSTFDQQLIKSVDEIKDELVYNLTQKINWYKTMLKLIELGVEEMYECGAGKDLKKISRFIRGDYKIISI